MSQLLGLAALLSLLMTLASSHAHASHEGVPWIQCIQGIAPWGRGEHPVIFGPEPTGSSLEISWLMFPNQNSPIRHHGTWRTVRGAFVLTPDGMSFAPARNPDADGVCFRLSNGSENRLSYFRSMEAPATDPSSAWGSRTVLIQGEGPHVDHCTQASAPDWTREQQGVLHRIVLENLGTLVLRVSRQEAVLHDAGIDRILGALARCTLLGGEIAEQSTDVSIQLLELIRHNPQPVPPTSASPGASSASP